MASRLVLAVAVVLAMVEVVILAVEAQEVEPAIPGRRSNASLREARGKITRNVFALASLKRSLQTRRVSLQ
jgi:hypothetical protein